MLDALVARARAPAGLVRRARVVLLSAAGDAAVDIAARLELSPEAVSRIRRRFVREGVDGLADRPKAGRRDHAVPAEVDDLHRRTDRTTCPVAPPPDGAGGRPGCWATWSD